jgi:hypothetical protein
VLLSAACFGPAAPSPPNNPPPPPPVPLPNTPPVIQSLTASRQTVDVSESIQLSALVQDLETPVDTLKVLWTSNGGSITGTGRQVAWQAPATLVTPADLVVTFTVIESYKGLDAQGRTIPLEFVVSRSITIRVHNSPKEIADLSLSFLRKFADSSVSPRACMTDFSESCPGKEAEEADIQNNRTKFLILDSELGQPLISGLVKYLRANIAVRCEFESRVLQCPPGSPIACVPGEVERASGTCRLTSVYERGRWWLCESNFDGDADMSPTMRLFFGK